MIPVVHINPMQICCIDCPQSVNARGVELGMQLLLTGAWGMDVPVW